MERRREPRLSLRCPIHFRCLERDEEGRSVTEDVSARGARFRTVSWERLRAGDRLRVTLTVPASQSGEIDLTGMGRVVRIEPGSIEERPSPGDVAVTFEAPFSLRSIL